MVKVTPPQDDDADDESGITITHEFSGATEYAALAEM